MIIASAGLFQRNSDRFGPLIHRRSVLPGQGKNEKFRRSSGSHFDAAAHRRTLAPPGHEYHLIFVPKEIAPCLMKILVVEDDRETATYLTKGLSESGYTVDCASDGREGLFLATSGNYSAMVLDRMLP